MPQPKKTTKSNQTFEEFERPKLATPPLCPGCMKPDNMTAYGMIYRCTCGYEFVFGYFYDRWYESIR